LINRLEKPDEIKDNNINVSKIDRISSELSGEARQGEDDNFRTTDP